MSNIAKLEFAALDISGKNYLSWILDAEIHFDAMNLGNTIKEGKNKQIETNFIDGNDIMNFNDPHQVSPKEDGNQSNAYVNTLLCVVLT